MLFNVNVYTISQDAMAYSLGKIASIPLLHRNLLESQEKFYNINLHASRPVWLSYTKRILEAL